MESQHTISLSQTIIRVTVSFRGGGTHGFKSHREVVGWIIDSNHENKKKPPVFAGVFYFGLFQLFIVTGP